MSENLKPKRLRFEKQQQIQPLFSMKIEQPKNLRIDKMKYEFSKPYCPADQGTNYGSDEEWATEPALDSIPQAHKRNRTSKESEY